MTKSDVFAGLRREPVPFSVGCVSVYLKPWTAATRAAFFVWRKANPGPVGLYAKFFALSVCDAAGKLLCDDADAAELEGLDGLLLEAVALRVIELNGLGDDPKAS